MARTQRLSIRQRPEPPQVVPLEVEAPPPAPGPIAFPICISFSYRGRRVLCTPLRDDAGTIVNLTFECPRCLHHLKFGDGVSLWVPTTGRVTAHGYVKCTAPGCELCLDIQDGQALDVPRWW